MNAGRIIGRILFLVLGVACLLLGSISSSHASTYLGEACFQSQINGMIYRLAVTDMGNQHFLLNGKTISAGSGNFLPIYGSAEIGQTAIFVTLNSGSLLSSNGTTIDGTQALTINFIIDLSSFNGTGVGIVTQSREGSISTSTISDAINFIACP